MMCIGKRKCSLVLCLELGAQGLHSCCVGWIDLLANRASSHAFVLPAQMKQKQLLTCLVWLSCNSCSPFSLMASPLAPPSRLLAPLYVPVLLMSICLLPLCFLAFFNQLTSFIMFSLGLDRILCTMTCMATNGLPPRRTCWSVSCFGFVAAASTAVVA